MNVYKRKIKIVPIPGVSSITTAMSVSWFYDKFLFYGFLPKKEKEVKKNSLKGTINIKFSQVIFYPCNKNKFLFKKFKKFFSW